MRVEDWQFIGRMALVIGVIFIVGGIITYEYAESYLGVVVDYPYRGDSPNLLIVGIALLVVGVGCLWRVEEEKNPIPPSPSASPQQDIPKA